MIWYSKVIRKYGQKYKSNKKLRIILKNIENLKD